MGEPLMYEAGGFSAFRDKWKGAGHSKLPVGGGGGGGGGGGSLENYIHSLREGSGKFYCGTTKIPRPHTPVISNDRSLVKLKS